MIDLKRFSGFEVVVQFKDGERWFVWASPRNKSATLPELVQAPDESGRSVPIPMPFLQGKVTPDGDLIVNTGHGGKLIVALDSTVISSVTQVLELASTEERSNLIVPGN